MNPDAKAAAYETPIIEDLGRLADDTMGVTADPMTDIVVVGTG